MKEEGGAAIEGYSRVGNHQREAVGKLKVEVKNAEEIRLYLEDLKICDLPRTVCPNLQLEPVYNAVL